ncbi:hypothetical protein SK128_017026, partial [Halocaridina rubra]
AVDELEDVVPINNQIDHRNSLLGPTVSSTSQNFLMGFLIAPEPGRLLVPFFDHDLVPELRNMMPLIPFLKNDQEIFQSDEYPIEQDTKLRYGNVSTIPKKGQRLRTNEKDHENDSFSLALDGSPPAVRTYEYQSNDELPGELVNSPILVQHNDPFNRFNQLSFPEKVVQLAVLRSIMRTKDLRSDGENKNYSEKKSDTESFRQNVLHPNGPMTAWEVNKLPEIKSGENLNQKPYKKSGPIPKENIKSEFKESHNFNGKRRNYESSSRGFEYVFLKESSFDFVILNSYGDL